MYICKKSWAWQLPHRAMPMSFFYVLVKTSTLFFGSNKIKQGESFNAWGAQVLCEQAPYRNLEGCCWRCLIWPWMFQSVQLSHILLSQRGAVGGA